MVVCINQIRNKHTQHILNHMTISQIPQNAHFMIIHHLPIPGSIARSPLWKWLLTERTSDTSSRTTCAAQHLPRTLEKPVAARWWRFCQWCLPDRPWAEPWRNFNSWPFSCFLADAWDNFLAFMAGLLPCRSSSSVMDTTCSPSRSLAKNISRYNMSKACQRSARPSRSLNPWHDHFEIDCSHDASHENRPSKS